MRQLVIIMALAVTATVGCGSVDDAPLGGPYGGTTGGTDPNSGQSPDQQGGNDGGGNTNTGTDAGSGNTGTKDSGTQTAKDSGSQQQTQDSGTQQQSAPTWTQIYNSYLAGSKEGRCSSCHGQCSSASNTYTWLKGKGYINGASSALIDSNQSCLSWYGGNMPPSGPSDANAVKDMNAWAAAGAANN